MKVADVMTSGIETVDIGASASDAAKVMKLFHVGIVPVMVGERVAGVVTDRDLAVRILADAAGARWTPVVQAMSERYFSVPVDGELDEAIQLMSREGVSRLIVEGRNGRPVGVISVDDVSTKGSPEQALDLCRAIGTRRRDRGAKGAARMRTQH
ncbi:MAG TPA: CBS domain-containing protein [Fimbriimonadaceae bacterium]|nr:CBS domain-containing protein [Fimbriimonadaceae bacterium]